MIHARTLAEIEAFRQAANTAVLDPIVRDAARRWVRAWDILSAELEATALDLAGASPSALRRAARLTRTLERIADELAAVVKATADDTVAALPQGLQLAGDANAAMIRSQLPVGYGVGEIVAGWDRVDTDVIGAILARAEQQIYASSAPLSASATAAMRENLIRGLASGDNPNDVARRVVRDTEGVFNGGLARAARIARTEMADAMRAGGDAHDQANADILTGWTWIATLSTRTCPSCWAQHGREWPLTEPGPLGHQNCVLAGAVVSGPRAEASTTRWFEGEVIDIKTRGGRFLSVTPNHPILTPQGWVVAGALSEGDYVIAGSGADGPTVDRSPDDYQRPALIEDVAETLGSALSVRSVSVPTTPEDFHGDGAGSQVHVVRANGLLGDSFHTALTDSGGQLPFVVGDVGLETLSGSGRLAPLFERLRDAARGGLRREHDGSVLLGGTSGGDQLIALSDPPESHSCRPETIIDWATRDAVGAGQRVHGLASEVSANDLLVRGERALGEDPFLGVRSAKGLLRRPAAPQATALEDVSETGGGYPMPSASDIATFAGEVVEDGILHLARRRFSGHVYNLQTRTGWYLANDILTHNCRCTRAPKTKTWRELGLDIDEPEQPASLDAEARFRDLDAATQRDILGPKRYQAWSEGRYPMDRWSQRTSTDGWRDSWRVSPIGGGDALPPRPPTVIRPGSEADDATSWVDLNRRFRTGAATFGDIADTEARDARFTPTDAARVLYRVLTGDVRVRSNLVAAARVSGPWIDRAYQATSTTKGGALRHATGDSDVLLEIHVPAGAPVMRSGSDVFLPRGSTLMLSNADVEDTGEGKMDTVRADLVASAALRGLST